ncbi:TlpA family protein disulfide reductase, partial [Sphingobacterium sp. IITKGP-BTPF85]
KLAVGQPAPDFESFTPNNKSIKLSDFKGKYVLLDFWASWCMPCRQENPNIVKLYNQYKGKGFDVFGVSLDDNPGPWMRAIADDQLQWTQASDLKAWGSVVVGLYRITGIPASYVLNPEGLIIAKNLRGKELEDFLKKTLK